MFKLDLEKVEPPEMKLPTSIGSSKKEESSRKPSISALLTMLKTFDCVDHHKLWKILKVMGIPDHLTCLPQNLYVGQEATVTTRHGTMDWLKIKKGVHQGCILSPCLLKFYAEYIMQNARWMKHKLESTLQGEISITLGTKLAPPLWHRMKRN